MGIPILLLLIIFGLGNARRAQQRGLNPVPWVVFTVLAFLAGTFVATFLLVVILIIKNPAMAAIARLNDPNKMSAYLESLFSAHMFLYSMLIFAGGFGGYLLVRYRLERRGTGLRCDAGSQRGRFIGRSATAAGNKPDNNLLKIKYICFIRAF